MAINFNADSDNHIYGNDKPKKGEKAQTKQHTHIFFEVPVAGPVCDVFPTGTALFTQ